MLTGNHLPQNKIIISYPLRNNCSVQSIIIIIDHCEFVIILIFLKLYASHGILSYNSIHVKESENVDTRTLTVFPGLSLQWVACSRAPIDL